MEETAHLRGGQAPSVKLTLSQRKTRDLTSSPQLLTVDMSQAKSRTPSSPDTGADEEKGKEAPSQTLGVGGNTEPHPLQVAPGVGWNSYCYKDSPAKEKRGKASLP